MNNVVYSNILIYARYSYNHQTVLSFHIILVNEIQDVYTLREVEEKLYNKSSLVTSFYGVVYACISSFDVDSEGGSKCIVSRW